MTIDEKGGFAPPFFLEYVALKASKLVLISYLVIGSIALGQQRTAIGLPSSKLLESVPGSPQRLNSLPTAMAMSPDKHYLAILNNGYGASESGFDESIAIVSLENNSITDFPDTRLGQDARQSYFLGLAFSGDGKYLYASLGSLTDPDAKQAGDTGNAIAVYDFRDGKLTPHGILHLPQEQLASGKWSHPERGDERITVVPPYPAGIADFNSSGGERLLVAENMADRAEIIDASSGQVLRSFDLSQHKFVPAEYPYAAVVTRDGRRGYVSLWNASEIAELDLVSGHVIRLIRLDKPKKDIAAGSHPTALLLSPDERWLYVALSNSDEVGVVDTAKHRVRSYWSVKLTGQKYGGNYPDALAQSEDGKLLFVANASSDAVVVFAVSSGKNSISAGLKGFIPTEWYPTALAVAAGNLYVTSGKGRGTGPNNFNAAAGWTGHEKTFTYIPTLLHGSLSHIPLAEIDSHLSGWTEQVLESNQMRGNADSIPFTSGNPIKHVIYIIKENRTYDQIFGDLEAGNGEPSLTMYGEQITPNQHKLARQFGVLDNFYDSGEVSGDGHVWSTAAITSDYMERTWQINYRSFERTYDYEGEVDNAYPMLQKIPDVDEPGTGYLWANFARHHISYRHYGEFISSKWCSAPAGPQSPKQGTPLAAGGTCSKTAIAKGEPLPADLGQPHGSPSPWPWAIPILEENIATKPELRGHFDPLFPDFNLKFPDQLRVDEFLNEFDSFGEARKQHHGHELPQFVLLRLPDDHTAGTREGSPTPSASVADNDLAVGRVVDAVSHSPYWDDTAIFILEDDAQNGPDHVDAHRSIALVISKYSPVSEDGKPFVDHTFYTTVNMIHTMESLLGAPPMNNNDSQAALMAPMLSGGGNQPPFTADQRNLQNGLIYRMNTAKSPGAQQSAAMDFSLADKADSEELNRILWADRMGERQYPTIQHSFFH